MNKLMMTEAMNQSISESIKSLNEIVIYLSLVVRRVAIRFRLSYYSQDEPGYSAAAFPGESCEPAMPLLRAHRWIPWLKSGLRHQGTENPIRVRGGS